MDFETRERLTDAMERAFESTASIAPTSDELQYVQDPIWYAHVRLRSYQTDFEDSLEDVDWQEVEHQLDTSLMDSPDGDDDASALEYTRILVGAAFEDAQLLITHSMEALPNEILENKAAVADILRKSKNSLLQIALLSDDEHRKIIDGVGDTAPLVFNGNSVQWADEAQADIQSYRMAQEQGRGCPAHFRTVEHNGRRTTLLSAFWDSLVDYVFKDETGA